MLCIMNERRIFNVMIDNHIAIIEILNGEYGWQCALQREQTLDVTLAPLFPIIALGGSAIGAMETFACDCEFFGLIMRHI